MEPIAAVLRGPKRVTALSGPVGSGKLVAVKQVARALGLPVRELHLEHEVDVGNLETQLLVALQPTLEGTPVWCVRGPELITPRALQVLATKSVHAHCLLLSNEKLGGWPRDRVLYQPKPHLEFCLDLAKELGARDAHVVCATARGDLRQVAMLVMMEKAAGDGVGNADQTPHAWMDSRDVLAGWANVPSERVLPAWIERNALAGVPEWRLEEAASYYESMAQMDATSELDPSAVAMATRALRRGLPRLRQLSAPDAPPGAPLRRVDLHRFSADDAASPTLIAAATSTSTTAAPMADAAAELAPSTDAPAPPAAPPTTPPVELSAPPADARPAATSSTAPASPAAPRTVYSSGGGRLLACEAAVRAARGEGGLFELSSFVEPTNNETARRMTLAILTPVEAQVDVSSAWAALAPELVGVEGARLWRAPCGMVLLLVKKPDVRLRVPGWRVQKLRRPDPFPLLRALADRESVGTMDAAPESGLPPARVTAAEAARHVLEAAPDRMRSWRTWWIWPRPRRTASR